MKSNYELNNESGVIFVVGNQRSGTTLISRLLDGHRQILSLLGESNFFTQMDVRRKIDDIEQYFFYLTGRAFDYGTKSKQVKGTFIIRDKNWEPHEIWNSIINVSKNINNDEVELKEAIKTKNDKKIFFKIVDIYEKYYWPHNNSPKYILEKTPSNEFYLKEIFELFPKAKIIHIIRDPFDVIESIFRGKDEKMREERLMLYINIWKRSFLEGIKYRNKFPQNYCFVKFENLIYNTKSTMEKLSHFLDIDFSDCLLKPTVHSGQELWESHTHQDISVSKGVVEKKLLNKDSTKELSREYMEIIGRFVGPEYKLFGWDKYKNYIEGGAINILFKNYPHKNIKNIIKNLIIYLESLKFCRVKDLNYF